MLSGVLSSFYFFPSLCLFWSVSVSLTFSPANPVSAARSFSLESNSNAGRKVDSVGWRTRARECLARQMFGWLFGFFGWVVDLEPGWPPNDVGCFVGGQTGWPCCTAGATERLPVWRWLIIPFTERMNIWLTGCRPQYFVNLNASVWMNGCLST